MLASVIAKVVAESGFAPEKIEDVVVGCANQAGEDSRCVARHAALVAGLPIEVPGAVLQRNCGSGLNAMAMAAQAITCGEGDVFVAGGVESMSRAPFVMGKAESAYSRDARVFDSTIGARFPNPKVEGRFGGDTMPETADNLARDYQITREEADLFAAASQSKYAAAKADGFFAGEIIAVEVPGGRAGPVSVAEDEHPRPQTDLAALAKLRPLFPDGITTAGNASGINDGAVAMIIASRKAGDAAGAKPLARILSTAAAGVAPRIMGIGPVPAAQKALERAGLSIQDIDVIEINEAFAAQVLACLRGLEVSFDDSRVNPNGGAIAIGHPLGASGPRIALTAARQLERIGGRYALVAMCVGVGQGVATVIERVQ
jgi:acetyl-CoA C-acetyltransferase